MELGPYFCPAPLDHPDVLLRRRYLRLYLFPLHAWLFLTRALSFARYQVVMTTMTQHLFITMPW